MRKHWAITISLIVIALFLSVWQIQREPIWGDEAFTIIAAQGSWSGMFQILLNDGAHPALPTILVKAFGDLFGHSIPMARLPSYLCSIAIFFVLASFVKAVPEKADAIYLAMAFLAMNGHFIYYMQEARPYALYVLVTLILLRLYLSLNGSWWPFFLTAAVLVNVHYIGILYALSLAVFSRQTNRMLPVLAGCATLLPWLGAVWFTFRQKASFDMGMAALPSGTLFDVLTMSSGFLTSLRNYNLGIVALPTYLAICIWAIRSKTNVIRLLGVLSVFAPVTGYVLTKWPLYIHAFHLRYYLPSAICAVILIAFLLFEFLTRRMALLAAALYLFSNLSYTIWHQNLGTRFRLDLVARDRVNGKLADGPLYCSDTSNTCNPINIYCQRQCIDPLPKDRNILPDKFRLVEGNPVSMRNSSVWSGLNQEFSVRIASTYSRRNDDSSPETLVFDMERKKR